MILYHILPQAAFRVLLQKGYLSSDGRRVWPEFRSAYAWMSQQMKLRLPKKPKLAGKYPLWAWATWFYGKRRPDLRMTAHLPKGTPGMLIEFEIDASSVLLSDFHDWHFCLNDWHLSCSSLEDDYWSAKSAMIPNEEWKILKEKSWERIFDLERPCDPDQNGYGEGIQASFWVLEKSMIKQSWSFKAR